MPLSPIPRLLALLVLLLLAGPLPAAEYAGRVVGVSDGDTLALLVPDGSSFKQVKIRLGEIDTPESNGQPYGERAKQTLSDLAYNKPARVVVQDTDDPRYSPCGPACFACVRAPCRIISTYPISSAE